MRARVALHAFSRPPWPWLFAAAAFGSILSTGQAGRAWLPAICGDGSIRLLLSFGWRDALWLMFEFSQPGRLLAEWGLMLLAMMPPLLAAPLMYVWRSSPRRRRATALFCFGLGYGSAWVAMGPAIVSLGLLLQLLVGDGAALAAACLIAMVWSASPWQQAALNRGHRVRRIGMFGWAANRDCLRFGAIHGGWCFASGWAWMLVPLTAASWHLPAMILSAAVMLGERLAAPSKPRWHPPKLLSLVALLGLSARQRIGLRHG